MIERTGSNAKRTAVAAALGLAALAATAAGASAQVVDGEWLPWLGCWVPVEAVDEAPMTCLVPTDDGGVELRTMSDGAVTGQRFLKADGVDRPSTVEGCDGVERATVSDDGHRVYVEATRTCEGDNERYTRGLLAMLDTEHWLEVETLRVEDQSVAWVTHYRPAPLPRMEAANLGWLRQRLNERAMAVQTARMAAAAPITVEAIIEATAQTDPEAVRSWISERGDRVALDADRLVRMADAGVPPEVIDVAVAVSYPERFQVARESGDRRTSAYGPYGYVGPWGRYGLISPYYYNPYYTRYGLGYGSGYGYGYGGYWNRPTVVVVRPTDSDGSSARLIKGRGYIGGGSSSGSGSAVRRSTGRSSSPSASSPRATTTGSSRPSSGSSGGSLGKAKPRGGN